MWASEATAHHDLEVRPNGDIYVLTREVNRIEGILDGRPFLEDWISLLGPDGREKRRVSVLQALVDSPYRDLFDPAQYYNRAQAYEGLKDYKKAIANYDLFLRKSTLERDYDDNEYFHKAFEKMNQCKEKLAQQ